MSIEESMTPAEAMVLERGFSELIEELAIGVIVLNGGREVIYANRAATQLLGPISGALEDVFRRSRWSLQKSLGESLSGLVEGESLVIRGCQGELYWDVRCSLRQGQFTLILEPSHSGHRELQAELLAKIGQIGFEVRTLEELVTQILDEVCDSIRVDTAVLALLDRGRLWPVAWRGLMLDTTTFLNTDEHAELKSLMDNTRVVESQATWDETAGTPQTVISLFVEDTCLGTLHLRPMQTAQEDFMVGLPLDSLESDYLEQLGTRIGLAIRHVRVSENHNQEQARLRTLIQRIPDGVILFNQRGEILLANDALRSILEIPALNLNSDRRPYRVYSKEYQRLPRSDWPFFRAVRKGRSALSEVLILDFGDRKKFIEVSVFPVPGPEGVTSYLGTVKDTTERSLQDRQKDDFLTIATHELRSPLTPLLGFLQMLRTQVERGETPNFSLLTKSEDQVRRLARLIDSLLDTSQIESGRLRLEVEQVDIVHLLRGLLDAWRARGAGREILLKYETSAILAKVDPSRIDQVMTNLVDNAIRYGEGAIVIAVEMRDGELLLSVSDQGPGIPLEDQARVFDRMYQSSSSKHPPTSMGLGLYISKQIVDEHGGRIQLHSQSDSGTCVEVYLPVVSH